VTTFFITTFFIELVQFEVQSGFLQRDSIWLGDAIGGRKPPSVPCLEKPGLDFDGTRP
jgi:hypothetical protein